MEKEKNNRGEHPSCSYRLKLEKNKYKIKCLSTTSLINNFKSFDLSRQSELQEGVCFVTEYGEHNHISINLDHSQRKKAGNILSIQSYNFIGILELLKLIIVLEKLHLSTPKSCKVKLQNIINNNHLSVTLPEIEQFKNYLHRYKEKLFADSYPQIKSYLTEICKKTYSQELTQDEMFFIFSEFKREKSLFFLVLKRCCKSY